MSKKINTTSIGLFIVIGVGLGVTGLLLFSSGRLFSRTHDNILYFEETLNGLNVGAPVKYRGVTIGAVKKVMLRFNQAIDDNAMPVIIEIDEKLLRERLQDDDAELFTEHALERRIRHGMRATLRSESLVTGVLYISLRPHPNAAPPIFHQRKKLLPEIPTEPTELGQLMNNLESLDIKSIEKNLNGLLTNLNAAVTSLHMADINAGITNLLNSANRLVSSPEITNDLAAVQATLDQYRLLGEKLNSRIDPLVDGVTNTLAEADRALAQIRGAGQNLKILLAPDAPLPNDLNQTLHQLSGAVQSLSVVLDFLKQHPNALITGREKLKQKP